jgi:biopolymer transport protein ExbB
MIEWLIKGGWCMIPLLILSVLSLAVVLERLLALTPSQVVSRGLVRALEERRPQREIHLLLEKDETVLGRFLRKIYHRRQETKTVLTELAHSYFKSAWGELEKRLEVLNVVATISPLLGLLGTVSGLTHVFQSVTRHGLGSPAVLSAGISEALITTITGLVIAVPALVFYTTFSKRAEKYLLTLEECAKLYISIL